MTRHQSGASSSTRPTGNAQNWKVRRVAGTHREHLGELRHVEAAHYGRWFWTFAVGVWLAFAVGFTVADLNDGNASVAFTGGGAIGVGVLVAAAFWALAQLKLLVFDRGIVLGNFLPFTRPMALPFTAIEAGSFRAVRGLSRPRDLERILGPSHSSMPHEPVLYPFTSYGLTFLALPAPVIRGAGDWSRAKETPSVAADTAGMPAQLWEFTPLNAERLDRLVHAIEDAMRAGGFPGAADVATRALPIYDARRPTDPKEVVSHLGVPPSA